MKEQPLYQQIVLEIKRRIREGEYLAGSKLPGHLKLAKEFGVSSITSNRALNELCEENWIERLERRGTFVPSRKKVLNCISIISDVMNPNEEGQAQGYLKGCLDRVHELELQSEFVYLDDFYEKPFEWIKSHLQGVIYIKTNYQDLYTLKKKFLGPMVTIGPRYDSEGFYVTENRLHCASKMIEVLKLDGASKIGFIGNLFASHHRDYMEGYFNATREEAYGRRYVRDANANSIQTVVLELLEDVPDLDALLIPGSGLPIKALPVILSKRPNLKMAFFHESKSVMHLNSMAYIGKISQEQTGSEAVDFLIDLFENKEIKTKTRCSGFEILRPINP